MLRIEEKHYPQAWDDILTTMRLGRILAKGKTLIEFLVGLSLQNMACEACIIMLESPELEIAFLNQCLVDLDRLGALPGMAEKISAGDRAMALDIFLLLNRYGPGAIEAWGGNEITYSSNQVINSWRKADWDPSLKKLNAWYDHLAEIGSEPDRMKRQDLYQQLRRDLTTRKQLITDESKSFSRLFDSTQSKVERHAEVIITLLTPAVDKVQLACDKTEQRIRHVRIALALAKYRREKKSYPETLASLSPEYLAVLPLDLFSGKPIIYRKTEKGYIFYSVGPNGMDDEGRSETSDPLGDDIVVQLPIPPLPKKEE